MGSTILVVEDDPGTQEIVEMYLRRDGHKVVTAQDGIEGLRLAKEAHPNLVVLDLMLPGLDGLEVCRALRAESEVPVVMLTARVEEEDRLAWAGHWRRRLPHQALQPQGAGRQGARGAPPHSRGCP